MQLISKDTTDLGTMASIIFNEEVKVYEKVFNYSLFQFIIDVGSSIGLWLGLSALSIYDIIVQAIQFVRAKRF